MPMRTSLTSARAGPVASAAHISTAAPPSERQVFMTDNYYPLDRGLPRLFQDRLALRRQIHGAPGAVVEPNEAVDDGILPHGKPRTGRMPRLHGLRISARPIRHPGEELQHDQAC